MTKRKTQILKISALYISAIYITYFLFGLGLISFMAAIPQVIAEYISIAVGLLVVLAGIIEVKDYFWYGEGFSLMIPAKYAKKIKERMQKLSFGTIIFLGIFVASVELPCTGGPYLAVTLLLAQQFDLSALILLMIYNVIFVLPLIAIVTLVLVGTKVNNIQRWKQMNKSYMRLANGIILLALGMLLMLIANGTINLI